MKDSTAVKSVHTGDGGKYYMYIPDFNTDQIQKAIAATGRPYEQPMLETMLSRSESGDLIVDVGANIGNHTVFLAHYGRFVVALEPNARLVEAITKSVTLNGYDSRVDIVNAAAGSKAGKGMMILPEESNLGMGRVAEGAGDLDVIALDDLNIDRPINAIKIDVEGMECDVLKGAQALIRKHRPDIYIEAAKENDFIAIMKSGQLDEYVYFTTFNHTPTHLFVHKSRFSQTPHVQIPVEAIYHTAKMNISVISLTAKVDRLSSYLNEATKKCDEIAAHRDQLRIELSNAIRNNGRLETQRSQIKADYARLNKKLSKYRAGYKKVLAWGLILGAPVIIALFPIFAVAAAAIFSKKIAFNARFRAKILALPNTLRDRYLRYTEKLDKKKQSGRAAGLLTGFFPQNDGAKFSDIIQPLIANVDFVVIVSSYPSEKEVYGGEFIRSRVDAYVAAGLKGCVLEINKRNPKLTHEVREGLSIVRLPDVDPQVIASLLASAPAAVLAHSPSPQLQDALNTYASSRKIAFWFHGFDIRDYRRLYFNFSTGDLERRRATLDSLNFQKWEAARSSFQNPNATIVMVSEYLRQISIRDVGAEPRNSSVIHNFIDTEFFNSPEPRLRSPAFPKILMMRPFLARNYGTDIATKAIKLLSTRPGFEKLSFTVRGFGPLFEEDTNDLKEIPNVVLENKYSTRHELKHLFSEHDIGLFPTRFDTQGVALGEAMASGLACVTHCTSAIPEFVNSRCAVLVKPECVSSYADAIWELAHDSARIRELSKEGAARMAEKCGWSQTIGKEIELIRDLQGVAK